METNFKCLTSICVLFLVIIAFSGFASASYVTDKKYLVTQSEDGSDTFTECSFVTHYSHYVLYEYWDCDQSYGVTNFKAYQYVTYAQINSHTIKEHWYGKEGSRYYEGGYVIDKTKLSPYAQFKKERGNYKGVCVFHES